MIIVINKASQHSNHMSHQNISLSDNTTHAWRSEKRLWLPICSYPHHWKRQAKYNIGGDANDTLLGEDGNDILKGGAGNDTLFGGPRNDILSGGSSNDILHGAWMW